MIGAMMVVKGLWKKPGVFNLEEMDRIHTWRLLISSDCLGR